jgi:hypothetical protein
MVFFVLRQALADLGSSYMLMMGAIAIVVMLWAPKGIWGLVAERLGWQALPLRRHLVLTPKAAAGNSPFSRQDSLISNNNSLFREVGNSRGKYCYDGIIYSRCRPRSCDFVKFPVFFPVSREFGSGDGFDLDCVRHHAVPSISDPRDFARKARLSAAHSTRHFRYPVSGRRDMSNSGPGLWP